MHKVNYSSETKKPSNEIRLNKESINGLREKVR